MNAAYAVSKTIKDAARRYTVRDRIRLLSNISRNQLPSFEEDERIKNLPRNEVIEILKGRIKTMKYLALEGSWAYDHNKMIALKAAYCAERLANMKEWR